MRNILHNWRTHPRPSYKSPSRKKHNRKSVSWHKRRILARLNPKVDKGQKIAILQLAGAADKRSMLHIQIISEQGVLTPYHMRKQLVQEHHRIVRALRYLVVEGEIESTISNKEWDVQLALGTAEVRKFTLKREDKGKDETSIK